MSNKVNIRDINPLEHITSDLAKARYNYESILNGLVEWNNSKNDEITVRLMTDVDPYFVDYTFPTRSSYDTSGTSVSDSATVQGGFSYDSRIELAALYDEDTSKCDVIGIRVNVNDSTGTKWRVCENAMIYADNTEAEVLAGTSDGSTACRDYPKNVYVRRWVKEGATAISLITKTVSAVSKGDEWSSSPLNTSATSNWIRVVELWDSSHASFYAAHPDDVFVIFGDNVYRASGAVSDAMPTATDSGWEKYATVFSSAAVHGNLYAFYKTSDSTGIYDAELYVYTGDDTLSANPPYEVDENGRDYMLGWEKNPVVFLPIDAAFTSTMAIRLRVTTDISGLVLQMVEDGAHYDGTGYDVTASANLYLMAGTTEEHKGLKIFDSANFSNWPVSDGSIWRHGHNYTTDTSIGLNGTQAYSAKMVFRHADPDVKQSNIINYDGPDLDQGLCIYLPVEDSVVNNGVTEYKKPADGYTFEFLFRIWPDASYNGHETADLIINKAQIYVYSVANCDNIQCHSLPIAKFSMARLTNFYVFGENIAVPNRPVIYKAKFIYSEADNEWKTYDYYQVPDHIFLSPKGFVDPSIRSDDSYGVETAGFPLVQDPFSSYDLSPVMVDDEYLNRIKE